MWVYIRCDANFLGSVFLYIGVGKAFCEIFFADQQSMLLCQIFDLKTSRVYLQSWCYLKIMKFKLLEHLALYSIQAQQEYRMQGMTQP